MTLSEAQEALLDRLEKASHGKEAVDLLPTKPSMSLKQYYALKVPANPATTNPVVLSSTVQKFLTNAQKCYRACETVEKHTEKSLALLQEMEDRHVSVKTLTSALYESFETLLTELDELNVKVQNLEGPLPYFTRISNIAKAVGASCVCMGLHVCRTLSRVGGKIDFSSRVEASGESTVMVHVRPYMFGAIDPTSPTFEQGIVDLDDCVTFLQQHKDFKDAPMYLAAYGELMINALHTLRDYAVAMLESARDLVIGAVSPQPSTTPPQELDEASVYYLQFHAAAPACQALTRHLDQRDTIPGNESYLPDVLDTYVSVRTQLLTPVVVAYLTSVNQNVDIVSLLRIGCQYMVRLCHAEYTLFRHVFAAAPTAPVLQVEDQDENAFQRMIFQLSYTLYHTVRPRMIQQHNLEVLCEIVEVLRSEVIDTHIRPRGDAAEAVEPVVGRMIGDAQERLILCTQKYIRDNIEAFVPTPSDLNYPEKLAAPTVYATWYPTLEHTLMCLSKVYRYVNMHIFEELAQDAVRSCTATLKMASADIAVSKGNLDGGLFLVKHLLTLRERIAPFDIQFSVTEKNLDFTSTTDAVGNILNGTILTDAFTLSVDNSILGLLTHGIPHVHTTTSDVKKDLEHELKKSCTVFIEHAVQHVTAPLAAWQQRAKSTMKQSERSLRTSLPHGSPDAIRAMLKLLATHVEAQLPLVHDKIHAYLMNASTESILFKPIQKGLGDVVEQFQAILEKEYSADERAACDGDVQAVQHKILQFM
ncbi:hypothetical protein, variant 1 [Aphanomyces invadans]|uniref:Conserved oligomeric Golgi complex subunit 3 n=1 Tax=Aphanomyces invadans TaxID=157072 RepID=A0A024UDG6_9STRA|nr:hypothetical protein, variant 1 [Aphanomyces invadans]ETW04319.1 hypothetical protein, variant 1 [Aphanomyces invadans]|eukprot:XP_008867275.1 hypothetical protein, variant 1 [Aphanomyces invadans]